MQRRVLIGTSGYSYDDWIGPVYPSGTPKGDLLPFYARQFPIVELNYTYYRQPSPRSMQGMAAATPGEFLFSVKAHRSMTHEIGPTLGADVARFREGLSPLVTQGRLAAVLLQFPYSFGYTPQTRAHLAGLCDALGDLPLAVEFRKRDWQRDTVTEGLRARGVTLVSVDEPALPGLPVASAETTGRFAYVRFHGRNNAAWWTGDNASRYDYLYSPEELAEWMDRIRAILEHVPMLLLFFNNHWRGNAAKNARDMRMLLTQAGLM